MSNKKSEMYEVVAEAIHDVVLPMLDDLKTELKTDIREFRDEMRQEIVALHKRIEEIKVMLSEDIEAAYKDIDLLKKKVTDLKKEVMELEQKIHKLELAQKPQG